MQSAAMNAPTDRDALKSGPDEPAATSVPSRRLPAPPPSVRSPRIALERITVLDGNVVAAFGNHFFQVRRGAFEMPQFDRVCAAHLRHRAITPRSAPQGLIALSEVGAGIAPEAVRVRQRAFMAEFLKNPNVRIAVIVFGQDIRASLLRSANRGVSPMNHQTRIFDQPEIACKWMSAELAENADGLLAALTQVRDIAERELRAEP